MPEFRFTLYLAGTGPRSEAAERSFRRLCARGLPPSGYEITVVDVLDAIEEAEAARILVTPTVVRTHPLPTVRVMGDVSGTSELAAALGLPDEHEGGAE